MYGCSEPDVASVVPQDLVPTPAADIDTCAEALSPTLQTGRSRRPGDPISLSTAGTPRSSRRSADACVDEDEINAMLPTPFLVHFVLGNFAFAMFFISLIVFIVFFAVTWLTVLRDARSMVDQVLSNVTGVSLSLCFNGCASLTAVVAVGIDTRPRPSTGSRRIRIIHFVDGRRLWWPHYPWGSIPVLRPHPRGLQTVR